MAKKRRRLNGDGLEMPESSHPTAEVIEREVVEPETNVQAEPAVEPVPTPPAEPRAGLTPRQLANALTVEVLLYVSIFVAAVLMRFIGLGARPLAVHEAANALPAWQFLQGLSASQAAGTLPSPLLFTANLFFFFLGAATDVTPRILPAVFGCLAVLLPVLVRREIGRTAAVIGSFLLLISSSLIYFSRDVNGVEISAVAGTAGVIWLWRYAQSGRPRYLYLVAAASAIALTASSAGFTILLAAAIWLLAVRPVFPVFRKLQAEETKPQVSGNGEGEREPPKRGASARNALLLLAGLYLVLSTALLVNREGLGSAFSLFGAWLSQFSSVGPFNMPLSLLLVYEPLVLVFGLAGLLLVWSYKGEPGTRRLLLLVGLLTLVAAVVYSISSVKNPANAVVLVIPLALLAGWFLGYLFERGWEEVSREGGAHALVLGEIPILLVTLAFIALIYLQFITFLSRSVFSPGVEAFRQILAPGSAAGAFEPAALLLLILSAVILGFIALASAGWIGAARTANLAAATVALVLLLASVRAAWLANYSTADTVHELLAVDQTPVQARDLVSELEWQSEWRDGDEHVIHGAFDYSRGPVVAWYLRAFPNMKQAFAGIYPAEPEVLVTGENVPAPPGAWMSERYRVGMTWALPATSRADLFKWLFFRQGGAENWQTVLLWVQQPK